MSEAGSKRSKSGIAELSSAYEEEDSVTEHDETTAHKKQKQSAADEQNNMNQALLQASGDGDYKTVKNLLDEDNKVVADVHYRTDFGITPLHAACTEGRYDVAVLLATRGGQKAVDAQDHHGRSPVYNACYRHRFDVAKYLIENFKVDVDRKQGQRNDTLLHAILSLVCDSKQQAEALGMMKFLVQKYNADINSVDDAGRTPAFRTKDLATFKFVVEQLGADISHCDNNGDSILATFCRQTLYARVEYLLEKGADIHSRNLKGETPLIQSVSVVGFVEVVDLLLENGARVDDEDHESSTALIVLCKNNRSYACSIARRFLEKQANAFHVNREGQTALSLCARNRNYAGLRLLLSQGNRGDRRLAVEHGEQAVVWATKSSAVSEYWEGGIRFLIENGCGINGRDESGNTPLMLLIRYPRFARYMLSTFLSRGADVNAVNNIGDTPLLCAFEFQTRGSISGSFGGGFEGMMHRLLEAGTNVYHTNLKGDNALSCAASYPEDEKDAEKACRFWLKQDDSFLAQQGERAIIAASQLNRSNVVRMLVGSLVEHSESFVAGTFFVRVNNRGSET